MKTKLLLYNQYWQITKEDTIQSGLVSRFIQRVFIKSRLQGFAEKRLFFLYRNKNAALVQMLELLRTHNRCRIHNHITGYFIRYDKKLYGHASADIQRGHAESDCLRLDSLFSKLRGEYEAYH